MNEQSFDVFTRRTAAAVTRRASLLTLGTAGLAAVAHPFTADAKKKNKNKNKSAKNDKKQCTKELADCTTQATQCAAQVDKCASGFTAICGGDPDCTDQIACCSFLASCDANAFFACLVARG